MQGGGMAQATLDEFMGMLCFALRIHTFKNILLSLSFTHSFILFLLLLLLLLFLFPCLTNHFPAAINHARVTPKLISSTATHALTNTYLQAREQPLMQ